MSLRGIRDRLADLLRADDAERERRARLVRAVCSSCGGIAPAGEGILGEVNPWAPAHLRGQADMTDRQRDQAGLPPLLGWRRRCAACVDTPGIVRGLLGVDVPVVVAGEALGDVGPTTFLVKDRWPEPSTIDAERALSDRSPRPWQHVTGPERERLQKAVDRARARYEPRRCVHGACAWCGASHSIGWRESPERWSDGATPAPLCRDCAAVWDRRGRPSDRDGLRACALEALSGASAMGSDGLGIRAYVDLAGDDHAGRDEPWTYAPEALAEIRERARMTWPGSLPGDLADEYRRAARAEREAAYAAETARAAEAEAAALAAEGWIPA